MTVWVDVVARARGLSGRLLRPSALAELAQAADLHHFAATLSALRGRPAPEVTPTATELEEDERRRIGAQLRLLSRWAGTRVGLLAPLYDDEDCRSLRSLVRGAIARTPSADRLAGLIPTPALPLRALDRLASSPTPAAMAALLVTWGHHQGPLLLAESSRHQPDLFALEQALVRGWAARSRRVASRGGRALRTFMNRQIDLANCWSALLVAEHRFDGDAVSLFIEGGSLVPRGDFNLAAGAKSRAGAGAILERLVRRTPLASATALDAGAEERIRRALVREQHRLGREAPLGSAPIVEFWLRLRGEEVAIRRVIWRIVAGAPAGARALEPLEA